MNFMDIKKFHQVYYMILVWTKQKNLQYIVNTKKEIKRLLHNQNAITFFIFLCLYYLNIIHIPYQNQ